MKYHFLIIFLYILLLTNCVTALTINSDVVLNTTSSNSSATFSFNINAINFTVEPNSLLIYGINFTNNTGTYTCNDVNYSVPNSNIDSSEFNCALQTLDSGSSNPSSNGGGGNGGGGYAPQTYNANDLFLTHGNNFDLRYNDKIKFIVTINTHTLTMQNFNSTTAKVIIQSNPITEWLQKGILYEFDVNNDSVMDIKVEYGGMNSTTKKAMVFIQKIVSYAEEGSISGDSTDNSPESQLPKDNKYSILWIILIFTIAVVLFFIVYKYHKKRRYYLFGY